jgi:hypothetical protein
MRRHASSTPWGQRVIIMGAYWRTSGYGLRRLHALGCLAVLVVLLGAAVPPSGVHYARPTRSQWIQVQTLRRDYPRSETPPGAASRARRWWAARRAAWATA